MLEVLGCTNAMLDEGELGGGQGSSKRAVILIFAHKAELGWQERIALEQCYRVLGNHPIRLVCPRGLELAAYRAVVPKLEADFIAPRWMASLAAYNRLKMSPWLYRRYSQFEFLLTYELDAFVFRDELLQWCDAGWDYIGAPWFVGFNNASPEAAYLGVGNSGFSLRRIATMLRISTTWRQVATCRDLWTEAYASRNNLLGRLRYFAGAAVWNNYRFPFCPQVLEDYHWCIQAAKAFPEFRLAPIGEAIRFSFEANPARIFAEAGEKLPFGCHKWMNYNPEFWLPRIRNCGYEI